jgi:hypothetical protein
MQVLMRLRSNFPWNDFDKNASINFRLSVADGGRDEGVESPPMFSRVDALGGEARTQIALPYVVVRQVH